MSRDVKAAARELAHAIEAMRETGATKLGEGRKAMRIDKDDILEMIGLRTRRPMDWFGTAAIGFGVGAFVGAAVALLVAPRAGTELREDLLEKGRRMVQRGRETEFGGSQRPQS